MGSITTNAASGDNGISAELFQILKDDAVKALHAILTKLVVRHFLPFLLYLPVCLFTIISAVQFMRTLRGTQGERKGFCELH